MYHAPSICLKSIDFHSLINHLMVHSIRLGAQKQMKKHLAIGHRSSYLIQQCSISLNLLPKKERMALKFKIDFNMISDCFINSHVVSNIHLQKQKYMVSSHCTITKFLNNTNIIHFLTNSKFLSNYFIFSPWRYKAILYSEYLPLEMKNKALFKPLQPLSALNSIYISTIKNINK